MDTARDIALKTTLTPDWWQPKRQTPPEERRASTPQAEEEETPGNANTQPKPAPRRDGAPPTRDNNTPDDNQKRQYAAWQERQRRDRETSQLISNQAEAVRLNMHPAVLPLAQVQWNAQREMSRIDLDKDESNSDMQAELEACTAQIQALAGEAMRPGSSWQYTQRLLNQTRAIIGDHVSDLSQLRQQFSSKIQQYAGNDDVQHNLELQLEDVAQRQELMEEYYKLLGHMASRNAGPTGSDPLLARLDNIDPGFGRESEMLQRKARKEQEYAYA